MRRPRRPYDLVVRLWRLGKVLNWLGSQPVVGPVLRPCFSIEAHEAIILPVQEAVSKTESVVLPFSLLTPLVEQASARAILYECMCRRGEGCQSYPIGVGCLVLGGAAAAIDPARGRPADVGEALSHAWRAMEAGLVPLIVHSSFDAWLLDIPFRRMLAVCFCCECCCSVRHGLRLGPTAFWDTVVRLPGLVVAAGPGCSGCGLCLEACQVGAIALTNGRARISAACKGCGRCVALCPEGAISLHLPERNQVLARLVGRIEARTDIGLPIG